MSTYDCRAVFCVGGDPKGDGYQEKSRMKVIEIKDTDDNDKPERSGKK